MVVDLWLSVEQFLENKWTHTRNPKNLFLKMIAMFSGHGRCSRQKAAQTGFQYIMSIFFRKEVSGGFPAVSTCPNIQSILADRYGYGP
jgi:hypothetical protein